MNVIFRVRQIEEVVVSPVLLVCVSQRHVGVKDGVNIDVKIERRRRVALHLSVDLAP